MITVARLDTMNAAFLLRSMLEANEIPAFIPDENTAQVDWMLTHAIGDIRVQIPEGFAEKAKIVLADFKANPKQALPDT